MPINRNYISKLSISNIKDLIYIIGIGITIFFFFRDKHTKQAILELQVQTTIENQENIMEKLKEIDLKFEIQAERNGKVDEHIRISTDR